MKAFLEVIASYTLHIYPRAVGHRIVSSLWPNLSRTIAFKPGFLGSNTNS